jgi:uncharacterized protein YxeA
MKKIIIPVIFVLIAVFSILTYYKLLDKENFTKVDKGNEYKYEEVIDEQTRDFSACNENGKIMILMYHKFSDKKNDSWTRTFKEFKNDLNELYDKGYRPISMSDYIEGNIDVPYGMTPVILTFDDGSPGQLNFDITDEGLIADENTAVEMMKKFNQEHPDFMLKGTFYITASNFFGGTGTFGQRLKYLTNLGFEIGNLTKSHYYLVNAKSESKVEEEVGGFAKFIDEYLPGYVVNSLSLPGGSMTKKFQDKVYSGTYEGFNYENKAVVSIFSSFPAKSPISNEVDLMKLPRIKVSDEDKNLEYWIKYFDEHPEEKFISDGDVTTFRINKNDENAVNYNKGLKILVK